MTGPYEERGWLTFNSIFATYALDAIGPTPGTSFIRPDLTFATGLGTFNLSSMGDTTFSATGTATPLPAALPLFAGGLSALALLGWRRGQRAA